MSEADGRWRGILTSGTATMAAQGVSLIASLLIVRVMAQNLGVAEFGLWLTLTTALAMLGALDFGLGPAVMTQVSEARGRGDLGEMQRVVSTAFFLLSSAALIVLAVSAVLTSTIDWNTVLGVGNEVPHPLVRELLFAVAAAIALSLPLVIARRVYYALRRAHVLALFTVLAVALQGLGVWGVGAITSDIRWFLIIYLAAWLVADIATTLLLRRSIPELRPRLCAIDRRTAGRLGKEGAQLFFLTLVSVVVFQSDAFIIGHYLGVSHIPEYVLPFKIFVLVPAFAAMFLTPLWATYREAWTRGDYRWVRSAYTRSVAFTAAAATLMACLLFVGARPLLRLWMGNDAVVPSVEMLAALACHVIVMCTSSAVSVLLKGLGVLRAQYILGAVMALLNIALSIWSVTRMGICGPLWATVATQTCVVLIPSMIYASRRLSTHHTCAQTNGNAVPAVKS
ncbi:oligosaccharide flippase family protein [Streptomyces capitiformicae]|nr:oligosaccharide flippase family protein [Streptomyces capitiformicae]